MKAILCYVATPTLVLSKALLTLKPSVRKFSPQGCSALCSLTPSPRCSPFPSFRPRDPQVPVG